MLSFTYLAALTALASSAMAQSAIGFSNTTFTAPVTVGQTWKISFTAGNGGPVTIGFGNSTYGFTVVDALTAPGSYDWMVKIPVGVVAGNYQLALEQDSAAPVFSPLFALVIPDNASSMTTDAPTNTISFPPQATVTTTTTVTAVFLAGNATDLAALPTVTYIYYEEECGCHKTSSCAASELPTSMATTTTTYVEAACGCTTSVVAPCAETAIPVAPATMPVAATNTPVAPTASPAAATPVAPASTGSPIAPSAASFTGAANKVAGSGFGLAALVAALLA